MDHNLPPEKLALRRAASILGGQSAVAALLGYSDRRNVWPWFNRGTPFPAEHCPTIEKATREKGNPVVCEELRPDVNWSVLRCGTDGAPAIPQEVAHG